MHAKEEGLDEVGKSDDDAVNKQRRQDTYMRLEEEISERRHREPKFDTTTPAAASSSAVQDSDDVKKSYVGNRQFTLSVEQVSEIFNRTWDRIESKLSTTIPAAPSSVAEEDGDAGKPSVPPFPAPNYDEIGTEQPNIFDESERKPMLALPAPNSYNFPSSSTMNLDENNHRYVGLVNQAMTCYLNSLIQTLYMTPEFRNAIYTWRFSGKLAEEAKNIPYQLQKLFVLLQTSEKSSLETKDLTASFGWESNDAYDQHDVQELCRLMFDALEHRWKKTENQTLIQDLYKGTLEDYVKCLNCRTEKVRPDVFLDLPLAVKQFGATESFKSIEEALRAFIKPEVLDEQNKYSCERCNSKQIAEKGLRITHFPYILSIQLKRFDFDYNTLYRIKLNDRMTFPDFLDLNDFVHVPKEQPKMSYANAASKAPAPAKQHNENELPLIGPATKSDCDENDGGNVWLAEARASDLVEKMLQRGKYIYELFSIMVHQGNASGGHYFAYIKNLDQEKWFCFNDSTVQYARLLDIYRTFGGPSSGSCFWSTSNMNAYMLMYRQIDPSRNKSFFRTNALPPHLVDLREKLVRDEAEKERQLRFQEEHVKIYCLINDEEHLRHGPDVQFTTNIHKDVSLSSVLDTLISQACEKGGRFESSDDARLVMCDSTWRMKIWLKNLDKSLESVADRDFTVFRLSDIYLMIDTKPEYEDGFYPIPFPNASAKTYEVHHVDLDAGEVRLVKLICVDEATLRVGQLKRLMFTVGLEKPREDTGEDTTARLRLVVDKPYEERNTLLVLNNDAQTLCEADVPHCATKLLLYMDVGKPETLKEDRAETNFLATKMYKIIDRKKHGIRIKVKMPWIADYGMAELSPLTAEDLDAKFEPAIPPEPPTQSLFAPIVGSSTTDPLRNWPMDSEHAAASSSTTTFPPVLVLQSGSGRECRRSDEIQEEEEDVLDENDENACPDENGNVRLKLSQLAKAKKLSNDLMKISSDLSAGDEPLIASEAGDSDFARNPVAALVPPSVVEAAAASAMRARPLAHVRPLAAALPQPARSPPPPSSTTSDSVSAASSPTLLSASSTSAETPTTMGTGGDSGNESLPAVSTTEANAGLWEGFWTRANRDSYKGIGTKVIYAADHDKPSTSSASGLQQFRSQCVSSSSTTAAPPPRGIGEARNRLKFAYDGAILDGSEQPFGATSFSGSFGYSVGDADAAPPPPYTLYDAAAGNVECTIATDDDDDDVSEKKNVFAAVETAGLTNEDSNQDMLDVTAMKGSMAVAAPSCDDLFDDDSHPARQPRGEAVGCPAVALPPFCDDYYDEDGGIGEELSPSSASNNFNSAGGNLDDEDDGVEDVSQDSMHVSPCGSTPKMSPVVSESDCDDLDILPNYADGYDHNVQHKFDDILICKTLSGGGGVTAGGGSAGEINATTTTTISDDEVGSASKPSGGSAPASAPAKSATMPDVFAVKVAEIGEEKGTGRLMMEVEVDRRLLAMHFKHWLAQFLGLSPDAFSIYTHYNDAGEGYIATYAETDTTFDRFFTVNHISIKLVSAEERSSAARDSPQLSAADASCSVNFALDSSGGNESSPLLQRSGGGASTRYSASSYWSSGASSNRLRRTSLAANNNNNSNNANGGGSSNRPGSSTWTPSSNAPVATASTSRRERPLRIQMASFSEND